MEVVKASKHKIIPCAEQINPAVDLNDPNAAITAVELKFSDIYDRGLWYVSGQIFNQRVLAAVINQSAKGQL